MLTLKSTALNCSSKNITFINAFGLLGIVVVWLFWVFKKSLKFTLVEPGFIFVGVTRPCEADAAAPVVPPKNPVSKSLITFI
jgi:hypothetical protein